MVTCSLSAWPVPTTAFLTIIGRYSVTTRPRMAGDKSATSEVGEFPRWVARSEHGLLWATFVLGAATLLLWTLPTGAVVFWISAITALAMIGIHLLGEIGRKADADIQADEDAAARADELEAAHEDAAKLEDVDATRSAAR